MKLLSAAASAVAVFAYVGAAQAAVISSTATLPLLDVPYLSSTGAGCFTTASVCVSAGSFTLTSVVSSNFIASDQDIVANASYTAVLTNLSNVPIGSVQLSGTVEQEVLGRTTATETGSWTVDLLSLSLSGPLLGATLSVALDPSKTSSGTTSIVPTGDGTFTINSFSDVFAELSLDTTTPLSTTLGPIQVTAVAPVPEPASIALFGMGLAGLGLIRRRKGA
jgi:hypothetical protein